MTPAVERAVARALGRARARVAEALAAVPGVRAEVTDTGVVASGRRLRARWLDDARLRWIGLNGFGL